MKDQPETSSSLSTGSEVDAVTPDCEKQPGTATPESSPAAPLFPETDLSRGIVGWDGQYDPNNPQMFASNKKWTLLGLISAFTFISPLASSMVSPAVVFMGEEFGETDRTTLAFSVSIFLIGYTVFFYFMAPDSELAL